MKHISFTFFLLCLCCAIGSAQEGQTLTHPGKGVKMKPGYPGKSPNDNASPTGKANGGAANAQNGTTAPDAAQPTATDAAVGNGQTSDLPDAMRTQDGAAADAPAPSTEGMSPGRAAKAKYMHKNGQMKAQSVRAESKLDQQKKAIAKSRASLESKKKKGKISAADYEAGMAKVKAAEEQVKYLETMLSEAKEKAM